MEATGIGVANYTAGWSAIYKMLSEGGSWSGRERHCGFLNTGSLPFADVSAATGLDLPDDGRGLAVVDWDQDGALDLWTSCRTGPRVRFLQNTRSRNHFLALRLEGRTCNRDAIGARVELVLRDNPQRRRIQTLRAGDAYLSQSSKWMHWGLGPSTAIDRLIVHWPGGGTEEFSGLAADRRYRIVQGDPVPQPDPAPSRSVKLAPTRIEAPPVSDRARVALTARVPMPTLTYLDDGGYQTSLQTQTGRALLINLWAGWCPPCIVELTEFADQAGRLRKAGLDVIALNVEDTADRSEIDSALKRIDWPFPSGRATTELLGALDALQRGVLRRHRTLPLPSSFLVDPAGQLAVVYKGPVSADDLLADVARLPGDAETIRTATVPFSGRWYSTPRSANLLTLAEAYVEQGYPLVADELLSRFALEQGMVHHSAAAAQTTGNSLLRMGLALYNAGKYTEAVSAYRRAIAVDPASWRAHNNLGTALVALGRHEDAMDAYRQALAADPQPTAHYNLAQSLVVLGREDEAVTHYRKTLDLEPTHADAHFNLGASLSRRGLVEQAIGHFQQAVALNPKFFQAHSALGRMLDYTGNPAGAIQAYRAASELNPQDASVAYYLGTAYLKIGDREAAMRQYETLTQLDPAGAAKLLEAIRGGTRDDGP